MKWKVKLSYLLPTSPFSMFGSSGSDPHNSIKTEVNRLMYWLPHAKHEGEAHPLSSLSSIFQLNIFLFIYFTDVYLRVSFLFNFTRHLGVGCPGEHSGSAPPITPPQPHWHPQEASGLPCSPPPPASPPPVSPHGGLEWGVQLGAPRLFKAGRG